VTRNIGMPAWIDAIRTDHKVGVGSYSVIDETYSDDQLRAALLEDGIKGKVESVRWARKIDRVWRLRQRAIRAEIF